MPASGYASPMANLIAKRAQLAAVRQKIGMEGSNDAPQANIIPASPTPPSQPPRAVVGPQAQAVMGTAPQATAGPAGGNPMPQMAPIGHPQQGFLPVPPEPEEGQAMPAVPTDMHPDHRSQMLAQVGQFLDKHGPRQQSMMDSERRMSGGTTPTGNPIKDFQMQMGRVPTPHEALVLGAQNRLREQLGRDPSDQELEAYFKPTGKEPASAPTATAPVGTDTL